MRDGLVRPNRQPEIEGALIRIADLLEQMTVHFCSRSTRKLEATLILPMIDGQYVLEQGTLEPEQMEKPYIVAMFHQLGKVISTAEMQVPVRPLDSYSLAPTAIKIDAEGAELKVVKGAEQTLREFKPVLMIENNDWGRVTEFLAGLGYSCFRYMPDEDQLVPFFGRTQTPLSASV